MSFYSSLKFYRPRKPPIIKADELATVVARLADTGKLTSSGMFGVKVKFGDSIDSDARETTWYETQETGIILVGEIDWDIELRALNDAKEVVDTLSGNQKPIYRAHISLGMPAPDVLEPITRVNSPENEIDFVPSDISLEIGPIIAGNMATEEHVQIGWISLNFSGYGYLYPWSLAETMLRASSSETIKALTDIVRTTWPVPSAAPEQEIVEIRRQISDVWPYEVDRPWDWYWGAHETG